MNLRSLPHAPAQERRPRLLAIGFLPPPLGGVSVSFQIFCEIAARQGKADLDVIDLSGTSRRGSLVRNVAALLRRIWTRSRDCDVVTLYCATPQVASLGLATLLLCRLRRKPFVLRKAAGWDYRALGPVRGRLAEFTVRRADLFLAQTRQLTELCLGRGLARTSWFPTSRPAGEPIEPRPSCRRFVYVGQVRPTKGLFELLAALERLPGDVSLDVYGPFYDGMDESAFPAKGRARYRGVLEPDEVTTTLRRYDAAVLPSKAPSEGYPGAILEAFAVGLPVVATTIGGIPEIVDESCGLLVAPGDTEALAGAMGRLVADDALYRDLCRGAREAGERFSAETWTAWLVERCRRLAFGSTAG